MPASPELRLRPLGILKDYKQEVKERVSFSQHESTSRSHANVSHTITADTEKVEPSHAVDTRPPFHYWITEATRSRMQLKHTFPRF